MTSSLRLRLRGCRWLWLGVLLAGPAAGQAQDAAETVRVHLLAEAAPEALRLRSDGGRLRFFAGDATGEATRHALTALAPGEDATIRRRGGDVYVETDDLSFYALSLHAVPDAGAQIQLTVLSEGSPTAPRTYAGRLLLSPEADAPATLHLVNQVPLDDYVAAVVSREYGFDDLEGAKAMAVLARTYALRHQADGRALPDHTLAQQYDGTDPLTPTAVKATRQTHGEVLTYRGALIEAAYFSSSGGHTADNETVWDGAPLPYLRGLADPYDHASPHAAWEVTLPRDRLLRLLSDTYGFEVEGFHLGERGRDGRVQTIKLLHQDRPRHTLRSNEFRLLVNRHFGRLQLKSTLFDAWRAGNTYVFTGKGFGHGVGLSQYGAREMSRQGYRYRDILAFYFADVRLEQGDDVAPPSRPMVTDASAAHPAAAKPTPPPATRPRPRGRRVGW